jgi:hypothetical protein
MADFLKKLPGYFKMEYAGFIIIAVNEMVVIVKGDIDYEYETMD